jgi:hypothetical protein
MDEAGYMKVKCPYCGERGWSELSTVHAAVRRYTFACGTFAMADVGTGQGRARMSTECYARSLVQRKEVSNGRAVVA